MKKGSLKYKLSRIAVLILTLTVLSAMIVSFTACTNRDGNDTDPNNGGAPNENNGDVMPSDPNATPDDQQGEDEGGNGIPNTLNGQTAEGTVYHILGSSATDAGNTAASEFMLVTDEGKHYRVNGSSDDPLNASGARDTSNTGSDGKVESSETQDGENNTNTAPMENSDGSTGGITLGDRVRIDITEGTDNGGLATVEKCKVTVVDKFEGTLLQAKVYTKAGIPTESLTEMNANAGWYHQRFSDYSDFGVFLDEYGLREYVDGMTGGMEDTSIPTLDEEFFKNNSIHIFALPYMGSETNINGNDGFGESADVTVYKDGDTLYLMSKDEGYGEYLNGMIGMHSSNTDNGGNTLEDAGKDIIDGVGDAANDIADGIGDAARDITDGIMGRNDDGGNAQSNTDAQNGTSTGTSYRFYIVVLGQDGNGLKTGVVLIDNR